MSNSVYEFVPLMGTNEIYRAGNTNACLEDDLVEFEQRFAEMPSTEDFAAADHTHDFSADFIAKALQMVADNGNVKHSHNTGSGVNMLDKIASWPMGMHTGYFGPGLDGNPNATEGFRVLVHKTAVAAGWILAFGAGGSVYSNYQHGTDSFRGWKALIETVAPTPLWTGAKFMNAGQTLQISKPLSQCKNGWMLEWSDYDEDTNTANNYNIVHTPIYKRNVVGNWNGNNMMFAIPCFISEDGATRSFALKQLTVGDSTLTGSDMNVLGATNKDVALRAVYEF